MPSTELPFASLEQSPTPEVQAFDYGALDTETRIVIQQRTSEIKSAMRRTATDIIDIGQKLTDVKEQLGHGHFRNWLKAEFNWSISAATKFMQVSEQFKCVNFTHLNITASALYLLAAPSIPKKARGEALERATQGEAITHTEAKAIVTRHKKAAAIKPVTVDVVAKTMETSSTTAAEPVEAPQTIRPKESLNEQAEVISAESTAQIGSDAFASADPPGEELLEKELETHRKPVHISNCNEPESIEDEVSQRAEQPDLQRLCTTLLAHVQCLTNAEKAAVFGAFAHHIKEEALSNLVTKSIYQDEVADLCNKCLASMDEQAFSWLKVEKINFSALSNSALKLLIKESKRSLNSRHHPEYFKGKRTATFDDQYSSPRPAESAVGL